MNHKGSRLFEAKKFIEAKTLFEKGIERGDGWCYLMLAKMFLLGKGVEINFTISRNYAMKAQEKGIKEANDIIKGLDAVEKEISEKKKLENPIYHCNTCKKEEFKLQVCSKCKRVRYCKRMSSKRLAKS